MTRLTLLALFLSGTPDAGMTVAPDAGASVALDAGTGAACKTVAECWLDDSGKAIKRPAKLKGRKLPAGNCGSNLLWLRNRLSCDDNVCVSKHVGDMC